MAERITAEEAGALLEAAAGTEVFQTLLHRAEQMTLAGRGRVVTYSRKVFIPLTQLCRDVCHYCTFAIPPSKAEAPYLSAEQVLEIARAGKAQGCKEALFTLGDKPELRYAAARQALDELGYATTLDYVEAMARLVFEETGLLPHLNPGVMTREDMEKLRPVSASMGLMLESSSPRLAEKGGPHWGSPDKVPDVRYATLRAAGELAIPFTTGLLIGIGETRAERIEALFAIRDIQDQYGHIQEVIIQNFRAKPGTRMAHAPEPDLHEHLWTIAMARLIFGPEMAVQAPPNLQPGVLQSLIRAGLDDWGGVSPVTPDHVNPEAPWPHLEKLAAETAAAGRILTERLAIGPKYAKKPAQWAEKQMATAIRRLSDARGLAREDGWFAGLGTPAPKYYADLIENAASAKPSPEIAAILGRQRAGQVLTEAEIVTLFGVDGADFAAVVHAADRQRAEAVGDCVTYVVNRNINYTNMCTYRCGFCAFSKGRLSAGLRGKPYNLDMSEVSKRSAEAVARGATEVCLQGGIHPDFTGETYKNIVRAVLEAAPELHVHAFSPLEVFHGAETLGQSLEDYLADLRDAGLKSLPGTAAEILDEEVRQILCPDKITTDQWFDVMRAAHKVGLRSTATIMMGHVDGYQHWARHLLRLRALQAETGGFTEFVILPFVHQEAPIWIKGLARSGPTFREAVLMHSVARLVLHPLFVNIQASWVKMGGDGLALCLKAGANDMGGTLMDESITRAAGGAFGQEMKVSDFGDLARAVGRPMAERTMNYGVRQHAPAA